MNTFEELKSEHDSAIFLFAGFECHRRGGACIVAG
jgi:hypothetical protein